MKKIFTLTFFFTSALFINETFSQCIQSNNIGYELNPAAPGQTVSLPSYPGNQYQGTIQAGNSFNSNLKAGYTYTFNGIAQGYITLSNFNNAAEIFYNGYPSSTTGFVFTPMQDVVAKFSYTAEGPGSSCLVNSSRISPNITSACNAGITSTITSLVIIAQTVPSVCTTATGTVQKASITAGGSLSYTYKWDNGETGSTATSLTQGIHSYTITGGCSGNYTGLVTITGLQVSLTASGGNFICTDNSKNLGAKWVSPSYKSEIYLWNDGITTYGPRTISIPGTYFATITNTQSGCVFSGLPLNLTEDKAKPMIVVTSGQPEICSSNTVNIAYSSWPKNNPTNFTYLWSNGSTSNSISTSSVGTFTLTMTDVDGCKATSLPIQVTTGDDRIIKASATSFCPGSGNYPVLSVSNSSKRYVMLALGTFSGSNPSFITGVPDGSIYQANDGSPSLLPETINLSFTGSGPIGYVTLIASDMNGTLSNTDLSQIVFKARNPGTGLFETIAGINNGLPVDYTGNYQRTFEFVQTAFDVTEMQIVFVRQTSSIILLDAVAIGKTPVWSTSQIGSSITVTAPGIYTVTSVNTCGVESAYQPITITTVPSTAILIQPENQTACGGNFVTFTVSTAGSNLEYTWNTGVKTPFTTTADAGTYILSVTGTCGTAVSSPATLTKYVNTSIINQTVTKNICAGDVAQLIVSVSGQNLSYLWSNSASTSAVNISTAGTYMVTVSGYCGTKVSNPISVVMKDPSSFQCSGLTRPQHVNFRLPNQYRAADDTSRSGLVGINAAVFGVSDLVSGNSGNIVALTSSNTAVATISIDNKIVPVGAGVTSITGTQAASEDYDAGSHTEILIVEPLLSKPNVVISGVLSTGTPIVTWGTISGAHTYCIRIYDNSSLSHVAANVCGLTTTSYNLAFTPDMSKEYFVQIAGENASGTGQYSSIVRNTVTSIWNDLAAETFALYPNPASDVVFIKGLSEGFQISISNVLGQVIHSGPYSLNGISISQYNKGVYYIKAGSKSLKLIVE